MEPLISVIVPAYRSEGTIHRCLASILGQTHRNIEVIVVHKPSCDGTLDEMKKINDCRLKILPQERSDGIGGARNQGIREAQGEYLGFVDADDFIEANYYGSLLARILETGSDIVLAEVKNADGHIATRLRAEGAITGFREKIRTSPAASVWDKLFSAELIKGNAITFSPRSTHEDSPFLIKTLYLSGKVTTARGVYYHYCPTNFSKMVGPDEGVIPVLGEVGEIVRECSFSQGEIKALPGFLLRNVSIYHIGEDAVYSKMLEVCGFSAYVALAHFGMKRMGWAFWRLLSIRRRCRKVLVKLRSARRA